MSSSKPSSSFAAAPEPSPPPPTDGVPRPTSITSEISGGYESDRSFGVRVKRALFGSPRDIHDSRIFHHISLIPFLAWVGSGADGLSSSAYGPEEAFRNLHEHTYLAVALAAVMAMTVFIISAAYRGIIGVRCWVWGREESRTRAQPQEGVDNPRARRGRAGCTSPGARSRRRARSASPGAS